MIRLAPTLIVDFWDELFYQTEGVLALRFYMMHFVTSKECSQRATRRERRIMPGIRKSIENPAEIFLMKFEGHYRLVVGAPMRHRNTQQRPSTSLTILFDAPHTFEERLQQTRVANSRHKGLVANNGQPSNFISIGHSFVLPCGPSDSRYRDEQEWHY